MRSTIKGKKIPDRRCDACSAVRDYKVSWYFEPSLKNDISTFAMRYPYAGSAYTINCRGNLSRCLTRKHTIVFLSRMTKRENLML